MTLFLQKCDSNIQRVTMLGLLAIGLAAAISRPIGATPWCATDLDCYNHYSGASAKCDHYCDTSIQPCALCANDSCGSTNKCNMNAGCCATPAQPVITGQPVNQTVTVGQTAAFSVTATGSGLLYQWQENGTNIAGASASNYTTPSTVSGDNGSTFDCVVSNGGGSVTSNIATLQVQANGSQAGSGIISGVVEATEDNSLLVGIPIELRNGNGTLITSVKSQIGGAYSFTGVTVSSAYIVNPVLDRSQSADPLHVSIPSLPSTGATANFNIRGIPAAITVQGQTGVFVLLTTGTIAYPGLNPPAMTSGSGGYISSVIGPNGSVVFQVPGKFAYTLTCWMPQKIGAVTSYSRFPSNPTVRGSAVAVIMPNASANVSCPTQ